MLLPSFCPVFGNERERGNPYVHGRICGLRRL